VFSHGSKFHLIFYISTTTGFKKMTETLKQDIIDCSDEENYGFKRNQVIKE